MTTLSTDLSFSTIDLDTLANVNGGNNASYLARQQQQLNNFCDGVGMTAAKVKTGVKVNETIYGPSGQGVEAISEAMGGVFAKHGLPLAARGPVASCKGSLRGE